VKKVKSSCCSWDTVFALSEYYLQTRWPQWPTRNRVKSESNL